MLWLPFFKTSLPSAFDISLLELCTPAILKYLKLLNGPFSAFPLGLYYVFLSAWNNLSLFVWLTHTILSAERAFHLGNLLWSSFQFQIWVTCFSVLPLIITDAFIFHGTYQKILSMPIYLYVSSKNYLRSGDTSFLHCIPNALLSTWYIVGTHYICFRINYLVVKLQLKEKNVI